MPCLRRVDKAESTLACLRDDIITVAPSVPSRRAMSCVRVCVCTVRVTCSYVNDVGGEEAYVRTRPMPMVEPVMMATLPWKRFIAAIPLFFSV